MIGHKDFYTSYDMFPNESVERIRYLMRKYGFVKDEASEYYFYEPYDESDWIDYE